MLLTKEGAAHFLALVPHARFSDVSNAGHMVAGDRNGAFTEAVVSFLRDRTRSGAVDRRGLSVLAQPTHGTASEL